MQVMRRDMQLLCGLVDGFVLGCLDVDGNVDVAACKALLLGDVKSVTFHRAFDMTRDPVAALETIAELGFSRVLTSGQEKTAHGGRDADSLSETVCCYSLV